MDKTRADEIMRQAFAIDLEEAQPARSITFSARALILATLPHRDPGDVPVFGRQNGGYSLLIQPGYDMTPEGQTFCLGYPYGTLPRLLLCWLTREALRYKSRELYLGRTLSAFMRELGLTPTGGPNGSIPRFHKQLCRLFGARISCSYNGPEGSSFGSVLVADEHNLWWDPWRPAAQEAWRATVLLSDRLYREITEHPVPLDLHAVHVLGQSPMAMDIYAWLTYRMSYLKKPTVISWPALRLQFGSEYKRPRAFREHFLEQLGAVKAIYSHARFLTDSRRGLTLYPSRPHVLKKPETT